MDNKLKIEYAEVEIWLEKLADKADKLGSIKFVTGIPRGGLIPAVMFSHKYEVSYIELAKAQELPLSQKANVLVIDDICDTGVTLRNLDSLGFPTAALVKRATSRFTPTIYGESYKGEDWLVFPWERAAAPAIQGYLVGK